MSDEKKTGLELLREPFPENQIGKLAKGSKAQTQCQNSEKRKCDVCGGFHHPKMIHLDYVGHAALTDRLLDADPRWFWEPLAFTELGLPAFDESGGLWIKLHVCGLSRIGYGHAPESQYKEIGSREKEVIGDALRNAAMRFGAALELWHKGTLHNPDNDHTNIEKNEYDQALIGTMLAEVDKLTNKTALEKWIKANKKRAEKLNETDKNKLNTNVTQYLDIFKKDEANG